MFQKTMLASAKSKAHEAFKNGNYLIAARIYGEAMELDPFNATLRSNSSLCWIRFGNGTQALKDAQACRMMRPGWAKGCHREGTALMLLKGGLGVHEDMWQNKKKLTSLAGPAPAIAASRRRCQIYTLTRNLYACP
uniref:Uncharacterized protein n=1 Tax=Aegilops tauschii subsp. strangulata TaxID=200361 RepID=A0A453HU58_AEGTS